VSAPPSLGTGTRIGTGTVIGTGTGTGTGGNSEGDVMKGIKQNRPSGAFRPAGNGESLPGGILPLKKRELRGPPGTMYGIRRGNISSCTPLLCGVRLRMRKVKDARFRHTYYGFPHCASVI
jgi:hypothetical protein